MFGIDLSPVLDVLIQFAAALLMAIGAWVLALIVRKLKLSADSEVRAYLETALQRGIAYAASAASDRVKTLGPIEVRSQLLAEAANYVTARVPDALNHFGITPEDLRDLIQARLPAAEPAPAAPAHESS